MLTEDKKGLLIFETFREDKELPKFREQREELQKALAFLPSYARQSRGAVDISSSWDDSDLVVRDEMFSISMPVKRPGKIVLSRPPTGLAAIWAIIVRVLFFWRKKEEPDAVEPPDPGKEPEVVKMSVEEFFSSVKNSAEELAVVRERASGYERALAVALRTGQKALYEKLQAGLHVHRVEAQLVAMRLSKYVEEAKVAEFASTSSRGLRLDWIRNFVRHIPEEVIARKDKADELGVFDNYVVLHYDPDGKASEKTEAEKEAELAARRDPVLFGLVKGSRRLYFVGDWVDEYCDLTLEQFADLMGAGSVGSLTAGDPYRDPAGDP